MIGCADLLMTRLAAVHAEYLARISSSRNMLTGRGTDMRIGDVLSADNSLHFHSFVQVGGN